MLLFSFKICLHIVFQNNIRLALFCSFIDQIALNRNKLVLSDIRITLDQHFIEITNYIYNNLKNKYIIRNSTNLILILFLHYQNQYFHILIQINAISLLCTIGNYSGREGEKFASNALSYLNLCPINFSIVRSVLRSVRIGSVQNLKRTLMDIEAADTDLKMD